MLKNLGPSGKNSHIFTFFLRVACVFQNGWTFGKFSKGRGWGVISDPKQTLQFCCIIIGGVVSNLKNVVSIFFGIWINSQKKLEFFPFFLKRGGVGAFGRRVSCSAPGLWWAPVASFCAQGWIAPNWGMPFRGEWSVFHCDKICFLSCGEELKY